MATRLLSSISNLTSKILIMIQGCSTGSGIAREVERLRRMVIRIRTVLAGAEEREIMDQSEKHWLHELKQIAYDAEDILSDFNYHLEIRYHDSRKRKFEVIDSIFSPRYDSSFLCRIVSIIKQFDEICHARDTLSLREEDGIRRFQSRNKPPSSSFLNPLEIFGRESEKREVIAALLTKNVTLSIRKRTKSESCSRVVALVGMAGIGKTTVAKLVFNDNAIQEHFQLKGWVWVSEFHDEITITKSIIESFTYKECGLCQLDALRFQLENVLAGKKFFLILNGLRDENSSHWEVMQWLLVYGAKGSRILITTENNTIAEHMDAIISIPLGGLSEMDSWALFSHHAFDKRNITMVPPKILKIGEKIVEKCSGVPLIVKALGALLALSTEEKTWEYFLQSNAWDLEECRKSMHILNLSYHGLPTHLKSCFRSCAMFPKGYVFEIDCLVQIWAAQGLIQADDSRQIEVGRMYVDDLMRRSFFQNKVVHGKKYKFTMHNLMHDLSKWIAGEETAIVENKELDNSICNDFRHLTVLVKKDGPVLFNPRCQPLRSLFIYSYTQTRFDLDRSFFDHEFLQYLHVLDLNFWKARKLPESISNFKHLRFLGLSGQSLPESVCNLRNLRTLKIRTRGEQLTLPKKIYLLKNLRHLIFSPWDVSMIPSGIGLLTNLQSLSAFVISKEEGSATLNELAKLTNLRDELYITGLHHITHEHTNISIYPKLASNLTHVTLHWSIFKSQNNNNDARLLYILQPQTNIQNIVVEGYRGAKLPLWFEDQQFTRLTYLKLDNCTNCESLPAVGQLPALKHLKLEGLKKLQTVGQEFYGNYIISFPSLETLSFYDMPELLEWYRSSTEGSDFPCLHELHVSLCQKLRSLPLSNLSKLHKTSINWCNQLAVIEGLDGEWSVVDRWKDTSWQPQGMRVNFRDSPNSFRGAQSRGSSVLKLEKNSGTNNLKNLSPTLIVVGCPMFEQKFGIRDKEPKYNTVSSRNTTVRKGSRYGLIPLDIIKKVLDAPAAVGFGTGECIEQKADKSNNLPSEELNMHLLYNERESHNFICKYTVGKSVVPEYESRDKQQVTVDNEGIFTIEDIAHLSLKQNQEQNSPMAPPGLRNKILLGIPTLVSAPTTSTVTLITPPEEKLNHTSY